MSKYTLLFFLSVIALSTQGQSDSTSTISLQEVVVTTQRKPLKATDVPYSVSLLTRKTIDEFNPRTTPEALMSINGVFVQKTNHGGGSPFIRGLTGNQTLLLIDGIRLNNSTYRYGPNQYLNTIDAFAIDKIEVARGTGSVQYGTDAIGGVLQVFTREPLLSQTGSSLHGNVTGRYMTGDMEKSSHGELAYSSQKVAAIIGGTFRDFGDLIGGKNTGKQHPSGYRENAFDAKITTTLNKDIQLTLASQFLRQRHVPVYHKVNLENYLFNEFDPQERMLNYARLNLRGHHKLFDQVRFIASWQQNTEGRISQKNGTQLVVSEKDKIHTLGFTSDVTSALSRNWTANTGIEVYRDKVGSIRNETSNPGTGPTVSKRGLYPDDSQSANYSVYTLHHYNLGKLFFDGGVRYNAFRIDINDVTLGKVAIAPEAFVLNGAVLYALNKSHHLYATVSQGFRAPNIDDMGTLGIVDFRYEVPAYDLNPEKSVNFELGYKLNLKKLQGTFAAYHLQLDDLITRVREEGQMIDGYQVYRKENVDKAYIRGFETALNWSATQNFEVRSGISYTYGKSVTANEPLRRIPPFNGRLSATYRKGKFFSTAELLFASKQDRLAQGDKSDNRIPAGGTPGWKVANFYIGYQVSSVKFNVELQNIFNEDYRLHGSGINGVGRSALLSINYSF